jgi:hypothetical protein
MELDNKNKKRMTARWNETAGSESEVFDTKSKNELESADVLSADSSSLPIRL